MRVSAALPSGVAALLFEAARGRRRLEGELASVLEGAGYGEVLLPILDYAEPYEALLSNASKSRLYRFVDRRGELLTLRADFTPMVARLLAPRLASLALPLRLFYRGDVVRCEETPAQGTHEFAQLGAELVGLPRAEGDGEVLALLARLLLGARAPRPRIVVGFAGALDGLLLAAGGEGAAALARAVAERQRGPARRAARALAEVVEVGEPTDPAELGEEGAAELSSLRALVARQRELMPDLELSIDLAEFALFGRAPELTASREAEGYYDGLVLRAYAGAGAVPVAAGGRYDGLFRRLGVLAPAAGFSLGLERLERALAEEVA